MTAADTADGEVLELDMDECAIYHQAQDSNPKFESSRR